MIIVLFIYVLYVRAYIAVPVCDFNSVPASVSQYMGKKAGKVETILYLSDELSTALKMRAVQEKRRYSDIAEDLLRQSLGLKELKKVQKS